MKYFNLFILFFLISACTAASKSNTAKTTPIPPLSRAIAKDSFPFSWFGTWVGTLEITSARGSQRVPMELNIAPTDSVGVYDWAIIYGEDRKKGLRAYQLRTLNAAKGLYQVDERNSIKMESYLLKDKLFCAYTVEGNSMVVTEEKRGDEIWFEIIFWKEKPISETGGEQIKGEAIPKVRTFPVVVSQRAILKRKI